MQQNMKIATVLSYITLFLGNIISLIYTPFMLVMLGSGEYGLFSLTNTIISYIYLLDMGFGNAIIRYNSKYIAENKEEERQSLNGMFLILYILIAIAAGVIGYFIYQNFDSWFAHGLTLDELKQIKIMFIIAMINLVLAFPLNIFSGIVLAHEQFVYTKILHLIRTVINPIIMIFVLLFGYGAIGMLVGSTIFNILLGLVNVYYCFKNLKLRIRFKGFNKEIFIEIFHFSFFIFLAAIAHKIYWSTDQFILGMFVSSTAISIYSIGSQLNGYFIAFSNVINGMFLPKLTKLTIVQKDDKELMKILLMVSRIQYFIATFIFLGFILVGRQFVIRWAGDEYEVSYYIALLVMGPQLISIIQALFATLLEAMNKHRVKSMIYLGVAILNLVLTLILVKPYGVIGCATATAIGMLINALFNNLYYNYKLKLEMKFYWIQLLKLLPVTVIIFIIGIIIVQIMNPVSYIGIGLFGVCFSIIYIILIWSFSLNEEEKNVVINLLSKCSVLKTLVLQKYIKKSIN